MMKQRKTYEKPARAIQAEEKAKELQGVDLSALPAPNFGVFRADGQSLSLKNTFLLIAQGVTQETQVGGFNQWREKGLQVRKGEKAHYVQAPNVKTDGAGSIVSLYFRAVAVFTREQCEPISEV